jgi:hypothetical protein
MSKRSPLAIEDHGATGTSRAIGEGRHLARNRHHLIAWIFVGSFSRRSCRCRLTFAGYR